MIFLAYGSFCCIFTSKSPSHTLNSTLIVHNLVHKRKKRTFLGIFEHFEPGLQRNVRHSSEVRSGGDCEHWPHRFLTNLDDFSRLRSFCCIFTSKSPSHTLNSTLIVKSGSQTQKKGHFWAFSSISSRDCNEMCAHSSEVRSLVTASTGRIDFLRISMIFLAYRRFFLHIYGLLGRKKSPSHTLNSTFFIGRDGNYGLRCHDSHVPKCGTVVKSTRFRKKFFAMLAVTNERTPQSLGQFCCRPGEKCSKRSCFW